MGVGQHPVAELRRVVDRRRQLLRPAQVQQRGRTQPAVEVLVLQGLGKVFEGSAQFGGS
jgi:hypothetical protein